METRLRAEPAFEEESAAYVLFRRGVGFLLQRHPAQAAMLLTQALRLEPGKSSIREALGRAEYALGNYERAAQQFAAIVADVPDNDYAHYGLARCWRAMGKPAEARAHLRLARALRPGSSLYAGGEGD